MKNQYLIYIIAVVLIGVAFLVGYSTGKQKSNEKS